MALATAHTSPDLSLTNIAWMQWVLAHAARVCVCVKSEVSAQTVLSLTVLPTWSRLELFVCSCALAGDVLSGQPVRGAAARYG